MKKIVFYILSFFFSILVISCNTKARDKKAIQLCLNKYLETTQASNGLEAIKYIDKQSIAYYDNIVKLTKTADSTTISNLKFLDKFFVLGARHLFKKEDILTMNGENLFILLVANDMVGDEEKTSNVLVQNIKIEKNHATGEVLMDKKGKVTISFNKINNEWKFNLLSTFSIAEEEFKNIISQLDDSMSEDDFLVLLLKESNQKEPSKDIWKPIL
ncbi:hypothetical protein AD998_07455 [bacterium 336/3]|nr:hypothetical protein AD998_07455 [bacterium 336/3]